MPGTVMERANLRTLPDSYRQEILWHRRKHVGNIALLYCTHTQGKTPLWALLTTGDSPGYIATVF